MYEFNNAQELLTLTDKFNMTISQVVIGYEAERSAAKAEDVIDDMRRGYKAMEESIHKGLKLTKRTLSGLSGGDAKRLNEYAAINKCIGGDTMIKLESRAIAVAEMNASMGRIVAAPTAGSCGILPAVIYTAAERLGKDDDEKVRALFTAAGIGIIISKNATIAGAEGGCQAECGAAASMAAAAATEMAGGSPRMALTAAAMALNNTMGLVCDPVAGLVEEPCIKRNAMGALNAVCCADMVLSGITMTIPFDEVVRAMYAVGRMMPNELKETSLGGIAACPAAKRVEEKLNSKK